MNGPETIAELASVGRVFAARGVPGTPFFPAGIAADPEVFYAGRKLDAALLGAGFVYRSAARLGAAAGLGVADLAGVSMRLAAVRAARFPSGPRGGADAFSALFSVDAIDGATLSGVGNGGADRLVAGLSTHSVVVATGLNALDPGLVTVLEAGGRFRGHASRGPPQGHGEGDE